MGPFFVAEYYVQNVCSPGKTVFYGSPGEKRERGFKYKYLVSNKVKFYKIM